MGTLALPIILLLVSGIKAFLKPFIYNGFNKSFLRQGYLQCYYPEKRSLYYFLSLHCRW